ncbi:MAG TPA: transaldolase [Gammaproteobacteria bacterium]|nr:transaldolase [Gammaproteobacteria bacterium]
MERTQDISQHRADGRAYAHARPTQQLHALGQSLWLDNISRRLLQDGGLQRYIADLSVTGLTSNPTIFQKAITGSSDYDDSLRRHRAAGKSGEELLFELMLEDLTRAADFFRRTHEATDGVDGWVSLELSPDLADDTEGSVEAAVELHRRAGRPNLFIKIPGTPAGIPAIEESIFRGVPINVTLLFSREQYLEAAEAYMRGLERRVEAGLSLRVASVASIFVSRWDVAAAKDLPGAPRNRLGIAVAKQAYRAYHHLYTLPVARWRRLESAGARKQRLLWASTGTKDPEASDTLYVEALAAPDTIDTMPDKTLEAFDDHGELHGAMPEDGGDAEQELSDFKALGVKTDALARRLQEEGAQAFGRSWKGLLQALAAKGEQSGKDRG